LRRRISKLLCPLRSLRIGHKGTLCLLERRCPQLGILIQQSFIEPLSRQPFLKLCPRTAKGTPADSLRPHAGEYVFPKSLLCPTPLYINDIFHKRIHILSSHIGIDKFACLKSSRRILTARS